jgi:hypothetical protein
VRALFYRAFHLAHGSVSVHCFSVHSAILGGNAVYAQAGERVGKKRYPRCAISQLWATRRRCTMAALRDGRASRRARAVRPTDR